MIKSEPHVSIDLETLDTHHTALVLSIGAVVFDPLGPPSQFDDAPTFYSVLYQAEQRDFRTVSGGTLDWWNKQPAMARQVLIDSSEPKSETLPKTLKRFSNWCSQHLAVKVWANAPSFDCAILRSLYLAVNDPRASFPFMFYNELDVRTMLWQSNVDKIPRSPGHHNALVDAIDQARFVNEQVRLLQEDRS